MRILTVRQPWAWAIVLGQKDAENRLRNIAGDYRGPVAIHAARLWDTAGDSWDARTVSLHAAMDRVRGGIRGDAFPWSVFGAIIGVADLVGVHRNSDEQGCLPIGDHDGGLKPCSRWAEPGTHHLVLANPLPLSEPIPYRGALGLRRLDAATIARVIRRLP